MANKNPKDIQEEGGTPAAETLRTKSAMMSGILAAMASMDNDQLMQWYQDSMELAAPVANLAAGNQASIQMKPSAAVGTAMKEDVSSLFEGQELTEAAQERISTLIEHAVSLQMAVRTEELEESYQTKLVEEAARIQDELVEKVDGYVTYAAEQWIEKNEPAIEAAIKVERAERLMSGLVSLFAECNIEVAAEKADVVESLETQVAELTARLNESVDEKIALTRELTASAAMAVFTRVSEGLTPIETDKFKKLVEDVDVDVPAEDLERKLTIIREAHFKASRTGDRAPNGITEAVEDVDNGNGSEKKELIESADPRIARYAEAISRASSTRYMRGTGPFTR